MNDDGKDIMSITLSSGKDKGPLQYISGEQKLKWEAIERVARRIVHNRHLVTDGPMRTLINHMEVVLIMSSEDET